MGGGGDKKGRKNASHKYVRPQSAGQRQNNSYLHEIFNNTIPLLFTRLKTYTTLQNKTKTPYNRNAAEEKTVKKTGYKQKPPRGVRCGRPHMASSAFLRT